MGDVGPRRARNEHQCILIIAIVPKRQVLQCLGLDLYPDVGITGTPVIDLDSQTLYLDAVTHEGTSYVHRLHALNILWGTNTGKS